MKSLCRNCAGAVQWMVACWVLITTSWAADFSISSPVPPAVPSVAEVHRAGVALQVVGSAGGLDFRRFRVEWAAGINPAEGWSSAGITLMGNGSTPVANSLLATWDSAMVTQAGYYSIRLLVDNTTVTNEARSMVYLEPDLYSSKWPQWLDQAPGGESVVPMRNALGQTRLALINPRYSSTTVPSRLWTFAVDGSTVTTQELDNASSIQPAVADLDGLPGEELVSAEWNRLRIFQPDGSSWFLVPPRVSNFQHALVNVADLDADSRPEIIALGSHLASSDGWLYAWTSGGDLLNANFPVHIPDADFNLRFNDANRVVQVDFEMDGYPELVVVGCESSGSFTLLSVRGDGTPGPWGPIVLNGTFRELAVGDLEHDGSPEIVVLYSDATGSLVQIYSATGTPRPGWPVRIGGGLAVQVVLGDLDRDGNSEVIVTEYATLYVFRADGSPYSSAWPMQGGVYQVLGTPVIADVDDDGRAEIVVSQNNLRFAGSSYHEPALVAFRANGSIARSWRLLGANGNQPTTDGPVTIGDFDADGSAELAIVYRIISGGGTSGYLHEGVVTVLRLGVPYRPHPGDCPMRFQDLHNSSAGLVPAALRLGKSGDAVRLTWPRQSDPSVLQFADDLKAPTWSTQPGPFVPDKGLWSITLDPTNTHRWYRLHYPGRPL